MNDKKNAVSEVVAELGKYLIEAMPSIVSVIDHFPAPNEEMKMPCIAIVVGKPNFVMIPPYTLSKGAPPEDPDEPNRKVTVLRAIGNYDFDLRVDIWCEHKAQRDILQEELVSAFNPALDTTAVNLKMANYYDQFVTCSLQGFDFGNSEEAAQRGEWRLICKVVANCRAVKEHLAPLMEHVEQVTEILNEADPIEPYEDDDVIAEV